MYQMVYLISSCVSVKGGLKRGDVIGSISKVIPVVGVSWQDPKYYWKSVCIASVFASCEKTRPHSVCKHCMKFFLLPRLASICKNFVFASPKRTCVNLECCFSRAFSICANSRQRRAFSLFRNWNSSAVNCLLPCAKSSCRKRFLPCSITARSCTPAPAPLGTGSVSVCCRPAESCGWAA